MCNNFVEKIKKLGIEIKENENLSKYTSFRIGGNARYFIDIQEIDLIKDIIQIAKEENIKFFILGNGTNVLFEDKGYDGLIIKISGGRIFHKQNGDDIFVTADAGVLLLAFCRYANDNGFGEIDKIYGIPGSVGGATIMNAGAFGQELKDIIYCVKCLDMSGNIVELSNSDCKFDYRRSIFKEIPYIVLQTTFKLRKVDKEKQTESMNEIMQKRIDKQPLEYPSAGSTFKRDENLIVSLAIDEAGLKGTCIGGAEISKKHGGFVINIDNAKASDVLEIVDLVKKKMKELHNVDVEMEVIFVDNNKY